MKACVKCLIEKPLSEFSKHRNFKDGLHADCKACCSAKSSAWYKANKDRAVAARIAWKTANSEKFKSYANTYKRANKGMVNANTAKRHAAKMRAIPQWANKFFIDEIYVLSALRTKVMGFQWHVDHIVPLQSKIVCGLHTEANLRVIPWIENVKKHNRYWPDMPGESNV